MAVPLPGGRWRPGHTAGPTTLGSGVMVLPPPALMQLQRGVMVTGSVVHQR